MSSLTSNFEYMNMAGRGHLTTQESIVEGYATRQSNDVCPTCEHPISDENPLAEMPTGLAKVKRENVPPRFRDSHDWLADGCKACVSEAVYEIATFWLAADTLEDVADLIAEHLGYKLVPVTA